MERWQRDLYVLWAGSFAVSAGFSLIMPFLPLYIAKMGVEGGGEIDLWTGVVISANFVTATLFAPIWGSLSDRYGRRPMMLRAAFGMAAVLGLMGLARSPWELVALRLLQGVTAGFIPTAVAYMAATCPEERTGYALGLLQTGSVSGNIVGPLIGGALASWIGYAAIFFVTGAASLLAGILVLIWIREEMPARSRPGPSAPGGRLALSRPVVRDMLVVMFLVPFALMIAEPIITLYLKGLGTPAASLTLWSGIAFSAPGVAGVLSAPVLGQLADRAGRRRVLGLALGLAAVLYSAQALDRSALALSLTRFAMGFFLGGVMPAANALLAEGLPRELVGTTYGLATSASFVGNLLGPLVGGVLAAGLGERAVFPLTGAFMALALAWIGARRPAPVSEQRRG